MKNKLNKSEYKSLKFILTHLALTQANKKHTLFAYDNNKY